MDPTRPTIAFTIGLSNAIDGPHYSVYTQAYGLEMSMPDAWPVNTLIMSPPHLLPSITESTGLTDSGIAAGASYTPGDGNFDQIREFGGQWVLARNSDNISHILKSTLGVLLLIDEISELDRILTTKGLSDRNFMVAFQISGMTTLADVKNTAAEIKSRLTLKGVGSTQILVSGSFEHKDMPQYLLDPNIKGTLLLDAYFDDVIDLVQRLAG
jgi:hypothetical protein